MPKNIKKSKYKFKISFKNGISNVKSRVYYKDIGIVKAPKSVKKPSKIKLTIKNKYNRKVIKKKTKFKVKIYTGKKYKTLNVKTNYKGILKISTKKLTRSKHKIVVSLATVNMTLRGL